MKRKLFADNWFRRTSLVESIAKHPVALMGTIVVLWLAWPQIDLVWQCIHDRLGVWHPESLTTQSLASTYTVLTSVVSMVSLVLALSSFWLSKDRDKVDSVKALQVREFEHIYEAYKEFRSVLDGCAAKCKNNFKHGSMVYSNLYKRYRRRELRMLVEFSNEMPGSIRARELQRELSKLDEDFMKEANALNLNLPLEVLNRTLNWIWAISTSMRDVYGSDSGTRAIEIRQMQDRLIRLLSRLLDRKGQFVFGKLRHHLFDVANINNSDIPSPAYRGVSGADRLFKYERSLMSYRIPGEENEYIRNLQVEDLRLRNMQEGLTEGVDTLRISENLDEGILFHGWYVEEVRREGAKDGPLELAVGRWDAN